MKINKLFYLLSLSLLLQPALACRLDPPEHNAYQPWGKGAVYMQSGEENVIALPELNFKRLRRLPNLAIDYAHPKGWKEEPPLTDLTTDYVYQGAQSTYSQYAYHSDGRYIVYAGRLWTFPLFKPSTALPLIKTAFITKANVPAIIALKGQ